MAKYTKYKVGDKVRVRRDLDCKATYYMLNKDGSKNLNERNAFINRMRNFCEINGYVVTIDGMFNGQYLVKEFGYYWVDEMFECLVEDEEAKKFESFLREVVDYDTDGNVDLREKVKDLSLGNYTREEKDDAIREIVEFYKDYEYIKKPEIKKHTMEELKEILGYDFELVED